jgi:dipeptidyl aminopeptidase/acylaminoacyl peptidase
VNGVDDDPIAPPEQSRALAQALGRAAQLITFSGEGHTLRHSESIKRALHAELEFLAILS